GNSRFDSGIRTPAAATTIRNTVALRSSERMSTCGIIGSYLSRLRGSVVRLWRPSLDKNAEAKLRLRRSATRLRARARRVGEERCSRSTLLLRREPPPQPSPASAGESHMEFFDSFPIQKDPVGFENFPLKPSAILKLRRLGFGKSYAIALPASGRGGSPRQVDRTVLTPNAVHSLSRLRGRARVGALSADS